MFIDGSRAATGPGASSSAPDTARRQVRSPAAVVAAR